jgi:acyl-CoA thioesterase-1
MGNRRVGKRIGWVGLLVLAACGGSGAVNDRPPAGVASTPENTTSGPSKGPQAVSPAVPQATSRVVFLGTSLTAGLGLDPAEAYPALLQRKADSAGFRVEIVNAGLSGETSAGAVRRAGWVLAQPAALVVLEVGANDGLRGVDPDSTEANLRQLVALVRAKRPEAQVALMQMEAPTNLGRSYTARFHTAYISAAQATGVPLWPFLLEGVAGDARLNQADGIHPNPEGARRVAVTVWRSLGPALTAILH